MKYVELAKNFLQYFYTDWNPERLRMLLADDCRFTGPFHQYGSADEYIKALINDPPVGMHYRIREIFVTNRKVCLVYDFVKNDIACLMCQLFYFDEQDRMAQIDLIFDSGTFGEGT